MTFLLDSRSVPPDRYPDVPPTYATRPTSFPVNQQQMPIGAYQSQQFHQQPYPYGFSY